jgi:hypothetical protein
MDFTRAGHLPNLRDDGQPADPSGLPRQRQGITPQMHGRYPDYDVLAHADTWDEVTRGLVVGRVGRLPVLRFFAAEEAAALRTLLDLALAQDAEPRIPVLEIVDSRLHEGRRDGFRYEDMPDDGQTWRAVAAAVDATARERGAASLLAADHPTRVGIVDDLAHGRLDDGPWSELNSARAWSVVMRGALSAFYSHPWAWNEIGFGGPAYPRGYMRLGAGPTGADPHEGAEAFSRDPVRDVPARGLE